MSHLHRYRPGLPFRTSVRASVLMVLSLSAVSAWCTPQMDWGKQLHELHSSGFHWSEPFEQMVFDSPLRIREFTTGFPPEKAASVLSRHGKYFQRVMTWTDRIMLSGLKEGWHWLAEIQAVQTGSKGRVSMMPVHASSSRWPGMSERSRVRPEPSRILPWLKQMAHLRFRQETVYGKNPVMHEVYSTGVPPEAVQRSLSNDLLARRWKSQSFSDGFSGGQTWRRDDERLTFITKKIGQQTAIFIHYFY